MSRGADVSLSSLPLSELMKLYDVPTPSGFALKDQDERETQRQRMATKRAKARDLAIPPPKNRKHREKALLDAEFFMGHYFASVFTEPFTEDRLDMIRSIDNAAMYGGDQAIAGARGEGKTKTAIYASLRLMLAMLSTFPIVNGKSQTKAQSELKTVKEKLQQSKVFIDDFPEIGYPFQAVGAWSSRGRMQTVGGELTNIELAPDHFIFPDIQAWQLPWGNDYRLVSNSQTFASMGIDGPIRGTNHRDKRPTVAIIDDIEDREAASSDPQIEKNEEILEQDIAGLGASAERIARVMLCTTQNRKCIAYKYTDPKLKPSWRGRRYRKMIKPPDRMDLVEQYITMRKERSTDDPDARIAYRFWRDQRELIEAGCVFSNPYSYSKKMHIDGELMELSAIQSYYNRVADFGLKSVATEIDNDPPEESGPMGVGITAEIVASRLSGLSRRQLPANTTALTAAIDVGKYKCHWVVCAWWAGAGGCVVDYGVAEVTGTSKAIDNEASEPMIYRALLNWRDELLQKHYVDATGTRRIIDFCMVDSGTFTNAVYEFTRQVSGVLHPSKGINPYRPKKQSTAGIIAGANLHAVKFQSQELWLYELDTSHWKQWVHERFLTPTFDETNMLRRGSLSLFSLDGSQTHNSFAHHIVAEEYVSEFIDGKGTKSYWNQTNDNNHWLDATYMAAAASEACGVKLMAPSEREIEPRHVDKSANAKPQAQPKGNRHGVALRSRVGGWIPKRRS